MEIRCLIIDDEIDACKILSNMLNKYVSGVKVLDIAHNVDDGIEKINSHKPDLIFLDIEMPNGNGFTLFEKIKNIEFDVIFATAYDQYAIKAIKYSALDYLLKPFDLRELKQAVSKVAQKRQMQYSQRRIEVLLENLRGAGNIEKITLPTHEGFIYMNLHNIVRAHADGNYSEIYLINGEMQIVSKSLGEIEELLPNDRFFRIHRSSIINLNYVTRFIKKEGNQVIMEDETKLDVSHRRKEEFLRVMNLK
ncbi:MAG: response regulator transcription factor [Salinivirgaceae bacterium]|nr:response regulator transcription factor [Salinivirgaceae bacterium]